jgi:group I intron endonuclease
MGLVYRALLPSGRSYIGMTSKSFEERIKWHKYITSKKDYPFSRAIKVYGFANIKWEILEDNIDESELANKEQYYIKEYDSYNNRYNATIGGDVSPAKDPLVRQKMKANHHRCMLGRKMSEETKKRISEAQKGRPGRDFSSEEREWRSERYSGENNPMYGRTHTPEARERIAESRRGRSSWNKGRHHTPEARAKMTASRTGKKATPEHRANMSKAMLVLNKPGKPVAQYSVDGELIQTFSTMCAAARYMRENTKYKVPSTCEIRYACRNPECLRYGFYWRFV